MHFFYLDESGDTGLNLHDGCHPIMVLGGISLRDENWNATHSAILNLLQNYFEGALPQGFELHAKQLLAPEGEGPFTLRKAGTMADDLLAIDAVLFLLATILSYWALRRRTVRRRSLPEQTADVLFILALLLMVAICLYITYAISSVVV